MTAQPAATVRKKMPVGKPFQKGADARRNPGGRKQLLSHAVTEIMTEADAQAIIQKVIVQAKGGDLQAIGMLWDRLEGKSVARQESGDPGSFDLDLSDADTEKLKASLRAVK